jgi:hypothetical protein
MKWKCNAHACLALLGGHARRDTHDEADSTASHPTLCSTQALL